jgi:regulator of sigma E protease
MDFWIKAAQLILSLSILVVLHELGHYIPAKLFKTKVEKFYLFFDPWFSLFKKKIGDTEWGIGWLPFGGYVKIAGMVDESMDKEQLAQPAQPWEFRSKKAWQRLIIMIGGVTVNLILGIVIYGFVVYGYGEEKIAPKDLKQGVAVHPYLKKYGIESGDNILAINDVTVENVPESNSMLLLRDGRKIKLKKANGTVKTILLPETIDYELFEKGAFPAFSLRSTGISIDSVENGSPASKIKLQKADKIIGANGKSITFYDEFQAAVFESKGKKLTLDVLRSTDTLHLELNIPKTGKYEGRVGFIAKNEKVIDEKSIKQVHYSLGESFVRGIEKGMNTLGDYAGQLKFLFTKKGASSIGGFGSIGKMFPAQWDWQIFWLNTAFISIVLAFMNILPIPALDGGHVVFLLYEIITGKEAPQKVLEYAQYVGFILLLGLLLYANGNDIFRAIFG